MGGGGHFFEGGHLLTLWPSGWVLISGGHLFLVDACWGLGTYSNTYRILPLKKFVYKNHLLNGCPSTIGGQMETESQKLDFSDRMTCSLFLMLSKYIWAKYNFSITL